MTLEVAELLESPVAARALEGTLLRVDSVAFFHRDQKSSDLVFFVLFKRFLHRTTIRGLLFGLFPAST